MPKSKKKAKAKVKAKAKAEAKKPKGQKRLKMLKKQKGSKDAIYRVSPRKYDLTLLRSYVLTLL